MHGSMQYMENYFDLRIDPTRLVPGAKSRMITLLQDYFPSEKQAEDTPRIAKYAFGKDYHGSNTRKLNLLLQKQGWPLVILTVVGSWIRRRYWNRTWAERSGLGWVGKNGNLINKQAGSFYFIATLITDLELLYDDPFAKDFCGTCTRVVSTPVLPVPYNREKWWMAAAAFLISPSELKDELIPAHMKGQFDNWAFGCDTCRDVCPWNRFSKPTTETAFTPVPEILNLSTAEWESMTEESFRKIFKDSPLKSRKFKGLQRNIKF